MSMNGDLVFVPCALTGHIANLPKIGPKPVRHPTIGGLCPMCNERFLVNDYTTLIPLGPGGDAMERFKCRQGEPYEGYAMEVHYACATGDTGSGLIVKTGDHPPPPPADDTPGKLQLP